MTNNSFADNNDISTTYNGDVIDAEVSGTFKQFIHEGAKTLKKALDDAESRRPGTTRIVTGTTIIGAGIISIVDAIIILSA